jgi:pyruvyltransferase
MVSNFRNKNIQQIVNDNIHRLFRRCTNYNNFVKAVSWRLFMSLSKQKSHVENGALRLFWYNGDQNLGDEISPFIVQKIAGMKINYARSIEKNKVLAIGSVVDYARSGDIVWGSGAIEANIKFRERDFMVTAVRGPKTREVLLSQGVDCPEIYGDPAMLISDIFHTPVLPSRPYQLGIVPHYTDKKLFKDWNDPSVLILDIQSGREKFLRELCQCQCVVSSSLHGIIFAESYGIPAHWMILSNNLRGGKFKFHDYYLGTDREPPKPLGIDTIKAEQDWVSPRFGKEDLLRAFPRV